MRDSLSTGFPGNTGFRIERISSSAVNHSGKWSVPEVLSCFRAERADSPVP